MARTRADDRLLLGEWACLGLLAEHPAHGYDVSVRLAPAGDVGRVWSLSRSLTYRALDQLAQRDLITPRGEERGKAGGNRTILAPTRRGRAALRRWLARPVEHFRDVRGELLLKLVLCDVAGVQTQPLLIAQRARFAAMIDQLASDEAASRSTSDPVAAWRDESSRAVLRFLDRLLEPDHSRPRLQKVTMIDASTERIDPYFDLSGKVALVTGGSRGLGYQMVKAFAERGADCIIASRKLDNCEAVADEVRALGRRALAVDVHAAKWDSIDRLIEIAYDEFDRVDILVNNAGMSPAMPSHEVTEALFDSVVGLNFKGPFRLASQVAKRMYDGAGGVIINVTSSGSLTPLPGVVPYGSAKAALNAMARSLAAEYGPKVRVNTLSPGPFLTDISKAWPDEARQVADNALGRPGRPEEIITAALFLASPASTFTSGALVRVDGGLHIGQ